MTSREWWARQWQLVRPYGRYAYYELRLGQRPAYFDTPWTYPGNPLKAEGRLPAREPFSYLFLPMNDWHSRLQRSQQLAKAVAQIGGQSVYVNPHLGLEYRLPYFFDPHSRIAELAPGVFELHMHLAREHELNRRLLTRAESTRLAGELVRLIRLAGIRRGALLVSFPVWVDVAEQVRRECGFRLVYDCHDWLPGLGRIPTAVLKQEARLFETADLAVFSAQRLQQRVLERYPVAEKSMLLRNAVELGAAEQSGVPRPAGSAQTIGYVGALDSWFDVDSVAAVATSHPDWLVELAGRVDDRRVLQLERLPNVRFLGEIPYSAVAPLLRGWNVGMIPFLVNDLTLSTNPIKLYEYFAAGLPVVSTRLPEVELFEGLAYLADDPAGFARKASEAMREDSSVRAADRIQVARGQTWQVRAQELLRRLNALG